MIDQQVKGYRYEMDARYQNFPVDIFDRIVEDIERNWPDDYERQAVYIKQQHRSYETILNYEDLTIAAYFGEIPANCIIPTQQRDNS